MRGSRMTGSGQVSAIGLRLEALDLSIGERLLFAGFSLQVEPGEVVTVLDLQRAQS